MVPPKVLMPVETVVDPELTTLGGPLTSPHRVPILAGDDPIDMPAQLAVTHRHRPDRRTGQRRIHTSENVRIQ